MRALVVAWMLAGCGSSTRRDPVPPPPACDALLAQFKEAQIAIALEDDTDPAERAEARAYLEKVSETWMPTPAECERWTPSFKRCLFAVKTEADNFRCSRDQQLEQGVDMGGPDCAKVVEHMLSFLYTDSLRDDPEIMARGRERLDAGCVAMPRKMKECTLRATSMATYSLCADPKDRERVGKALRGLP